MSLNVPEDDDDLWSVGKCKEPFHCCHFILQQLFLEFSLGSTFQWIPPQMWRAKRTPAHLLAPLVPRPSRVGAPLSPNPSVRAPHLCSLRLSENIVGGVQSSTKRSLAKARPVHWETVASRLRTMSAATGLRARRPVHCGEKNPVESLSRSVTRAGRLRKTPFDAFFNLN